MEKTLMMLLVLHWKQSQNVHSPGFPSHFSTGSCPIHGQCSITKLFPSNLLCQLMHFHVSSFKSVVLRRFRFLSLLWMDAEDGPQICGRHQACSRWSSVQSSCHSYTAWWTHTMVDLKLLLQWNLRPLHPSQTVIGEWQVAKHKRCIMFLELQSRDLSDLLLHHVLLPSVTAPWSVLVSTGGNNNMQLQPPPP